MSNPLAGERIVRQTSNQLSYGTDVVVTRAIHQPSFWAVLLLRILSFVLPMYLIVQACLSFRRYRQMRIAAGM